MENTIRRKLNVKFALCLLGGLAVLAVGAYFLNAYQVRRNAGIFLSHAERAEKEKDYDKAARYYSRYLVYVPDDTDTMARYGEVQVKRSEKSPKERGRALDILEQVLRRDPNRPAIRRQVVDLAMDLERFADARTHLGILLKASPTDGELYYLQGKTFEAEKQYPEAEKSYREAIKHPPKPVEGYVRLATVLWRHYLKVKDADDVLETMVNEKQSFQAYLRRAQYLRVRSVDDDDRDKLLERAVKDLKHLTQKFDADDAELLLEWAELFLVQKKVDEARAKAERGLAKHPENVEMYLVLARLEMRAQRTEKAIASLRQGLEKLPEHVELLWNLADLLMQQRELNEAAEVMVRLRRQRREFAPLDYLDACILAQKKEWYEAAQMLENASPKLVHWPGLVARSSLVLGLCYEQLGDPDQQYVAFRRAQSADPLSDAATHGMARALTSLGKMDDAIEAYRGLLTKATGVRVVLARLLLARNLNLPKDAKRSWEEVDRLVEEAEKENPKSTEVLLVRAESLAARDQFDKTEGLLTKTLAAEPKRVEVWVALAGLAQHQSQPQKALEILNEAERKLGDNVDLRLARVRYWSQQGGKEAAQALKLLTAGVEKFDKNDQRRLLKVLSDAFLALGDIPQAEQLLNRLAAQLPNHLGIKLAQFDLALEGGKATSMEKLVSEMKRLEGSEGTGWRYARARQLMWRVQEGGSKKSLDEVRSLLSFVVAKRPTWPRVAVCQGVLEDLQGNPNAALPHYRRAIDLGERSLAVVKITVQMLLDRKLDEEVAELLQKLPERTILLGDLQGVELQLSLRNRDFPRALSLAGKAVADNPNDARNHLWLGHVYKIIDRKPEAEQSLRQAIKLAPKAPETWLTLVRFLAEIGEKDRAGSEIEKMRQQLPKDQVSLALAQCYAVVGNTEYAEKMFKQALEEQRESLPALSGMVNLYLRSNEVEKAKPYLKKIITLKNKGPQEAEAARRLLILLLAFSGDDYQKSQEALATAGILNTGGKDAPKGKETVEELRTRALALAALKRRPERLKAIGILEQIKMSQPLTGNDQLFLARLYDQVGDWRKARDLMEGLVSKNGNNPLYLAEFIRSLVRHKEADAAQRWVEQLEKILPKEPGTLELKARVLHGMGKGKEAAGLLKKFAEENPDRVGAVARLLDQLGQVEDARAMYERFVATSKEEPLSLFVYAGFLARQNQVTKALDLCEKAAKTCTPEMLAANSVEILYLGKSTKEDHQRVARWLEDAVKKTPEKLILINYLAGLYNLQGNYPEAEAWYRKALKVNDRDPTALNNLAWFLAFQPNKNAEALDLIDRAIRLAGPLPSLLDTRGVIHQLAGRIDLALKDLKESALEEPNGSVYFHLAQAHFKAKNGRDAALVALTDADEYGLKESELHPLERPAYHQLCKDLGVEPKK